MKKRLTAIMTAMLCMSAPMTAFAEDVIVETAPPRPVYSGVTGEITMYTLPEVTIKTDKFTYISNTKVSDRQGFYLLTDIAAPDLMIVGTEYTEEGDFWGYIVTPINTLGYGVENLQHGIGTINRYVLDYNFGEEQPDFKIGDLIQVDGHLCGGYATDMECEPEVRMECIGNGVDVFGEAFARVIRMQMVIDQKMCDTWDERREGYYTYEIVKGDVNIDDELSVLDCLAINRNLLIGEPLCDYAKVAGDINENGMIDAVDSLSILKECINITENFE